MRLLAIGDIHGCSRALAKVLDAVAPAAEDTLIALGDYVDRGPDSRGVLDVLTDLYAQGRLIPLRGNHDQMMLDSAHDCTYQEMWLACGGKETLASYGVTAGSPVALDAIPDKHWDFLEEALLDWYETDQHFFVHANAYPDLELAEQPNYMLFWEKLYQPCVHVSGKIMICGHTKQRTGRPWHLGSTICIDTGVYDRNGWLTCLDVLSGHYWQANERGESRTDFLKEDSGDAPAEPL
jgi:serine/threonine protein phosphatase 1